MRKNPCAACLCVVLMALGGAPAVASQPERGNLETEVPTDGGASVWLGSGFAPEEQELIESGLYTSPLVIPAAGFTDDGFDPDSVFFSFGSGNFRGNAQAYGCVGAPAYLPAGVTVTDMFVSVYDNDPARNMTVALRRVDNFSGVGSVMASAVTSSAFAGIQTISDATIDFPLVRYPDYSYYVTTCLGSADIQIYSIRLYYTQ